MPHSGSELKQLAIGVVGIVILVTSQPYSGRLLKMSLMLLVGMMTGWENNL
jgi:hypothetical protein